MTHFSRWLSTVLAVCILINTIPISSFAQTSETEESLLTTDNGPAALLEMEATESSEPETEATESSEPETEATESSEPETEATESSEPETEATEASEPETEATESSEPETEATEPSEPETEATEPSEPETVPTEGETLPEELVNFFVSDPGAQAFEAVLAANGITGALSEDAGTVTLTVNDPKILVLLSGQPAANYQKWNILFSISGSFTLSDESFAGLGSEEYPFAGKVSCAQALTIICSKTLFNALNAGVLFENISISWTGPSNLPILAGTLDADGEHPSGNLPPLIGATSFSPYIGRLTKGEGVTADVITIPSLSYILNEAAYASYPGDTGLVCGTMDAGTKLKLTSLSASAFTLKSSKNTEEDVGKDAGGLVGHMGAGAEFEISDLLSLDATLDGENIGGLVGSMEDGATLTISGAVTLTAKASNGSTNFGGLVGSLTNGTIALNAGVKLTAGMAGSVSVTGAAGGIAGVATTQNGPFTGSDTITMQSVTAYGEENAGVLYGDCTVSGTFSPLDRVTLSDEATYTVKGASSGGVFGTLTLSGDSGRCELIGSEGSKKLNTTFPANTTMFGGVVGTLKGQRKNALVIQKFTVSSEFTGGIDNTYASYPTFYGGLAAKQETNVTLDVLSSTVSIKNVKTSSTGTTPKNCAYAGLVAYVSDGALLLAEEMTIKLSNYGSDHCGGGVAGYTGKGSIVYLKGSLDMSECPLITKLNSGQIVAYQDCSLIYGPDVSIKRYSSGLQLDDIGNYGELYRVPNTESDAFLTLNPQTYETTFRVLNKADGEYVLSSPQDYACLALAWQSRGAFATVSETWSDIKTSTIRLGHDIVLTDMGIGGLSRDVESDSDTFQGALYGNGNTIKLGIGASNSANGVTTGDGRIYWHNSPGLFAVLSGGATVENLNLGGSIRVSNEKLSGNYWMASGALAAQLNCDRTPDTPLGNGVTTQAEIDVLCDGRYRLYVGGLIGNVKGAENTTLNLDSPQAATITASTASTSGNSNHFGGVIGAIQASTPLDIDCKSGTNLGGSITITGSVTDLYAGALLGTAFPDATKAGIRTITFNSVTVNGFKLSSNTSTRMSGILGGIWGNTDVVMNGLTVTAATLDSQGAAALGGLVYRASGKWTVKNVGLSGLEIKASNATALGLLVCKGGSYKESINGSFQNIGGLYLEMTEDWKNAYTVPTDGKVSFGSGIFDEFVAYSAYQSSSGDYQITYSGSGIISLTTESGTVTMVDGGTRNTYVNRTDVGKTKKTNTYSRYYYNLPKVLDECTDNTVDTASELLIWSVCRYADSKLSTYFKKYDTTGTMVLVDGETLAVKTEIGAETGKANFDMNGLSYYPIRIVNSDITVKNANITFYNHQIEALETENKSTRSATQHYTMHCGLFLDFVADGTTGANYTMTVNGVSFDGTVGRVNDQSGALVCGTVAGGQTGANTSVCNVVLGESDANGNAVTLDGIRVDSTEEYKPVLIGNMGNYISLKANYVTYSSEKYPSAEQPSAAGSSLIGDVGKADAKSVSLEFAGTIQLPYANNSGVFTRATLLNSISYNIGSATYRFKKDKGEAGNATFGYELGWNGNTPVSVEYAGKQGWYDGASIENDPRIDFEYGNSLPYVWCSPAKPQEGFDLSDMHELAVNIPSIDLLDGCGTYGHPYRIDANKLEVIAKYINNPANATNDWKVRVPLSKNTPYHISDDDDRDVVLIYDRTSGWNLNGTSYDVRKHLAEAYYQIQGNTQLTNFEGIGVSGYPFSGVIDGNNHTVTLQGLKGSFINYSYGSVVRNLTIELNQSLTITANTAPEMKIENGTTTRSPQQAPSNFFGGVIGCVLGGDNIIDGVTISGGSNIKAEGTYAHLVPIGGFVGVIAGGGVIFRGNCSGKISADNPNQLYRNPIIGRVLGGFAFKESGCTIDDNSTVGDDDNRNYKINTLSSPNGSLSWDSATKTLTVHSAEGLLILSAIVSSGAGSSTSNAYTKGTARIASYEKIGQADGEQDSKLDGNVPYLLSKTGIGSAAICVESTDGINLNFAAGNTAFGMSSYGNGYRGLSARYVSNAGFVGSDLTPYTVVMRIKSFNGNGRTVSGIKMNVKEYDNDDFHAASMGGIFNIVWTKYRDGGTADSILAQNLTLESCTVSLTYWNNNGAPQKQADTDTFKDRDGLSCVAVGGFAGSVSDLAGKLRANYYDDMGSKVTNYLLTELHITGNEGNRSNITGPNSAGGLIGATAMTNGTIIGCPGKLLSNSEYTQFGPSFLNCSYIYTDVTAKLVAGGLVGEVFAYGNGNIPTFRGLGISATSYYAGCYATCSVNREMTLGSHSNILTTATGSLSSGVFGAVGMRARFNNAEAADKTGLSIPKSGFQTIQLEYVTIEAKTTDNIIIKTSDNGDNACDGNNTTGAAGCVARIGSINPAYFHNVSLTNCIISSGDAYYNKKAMGYSGGIIASGYTNTAISVYDTSMKDTSIIAQYAGGLAGIVKDASTSVLNAVNCDIDGCTINGRTGAGGVVGFARYNFNFFSIRISNTSVQKAVVSDKTNVGRLIGEPKDLMLTAAGISVVKTADSSATIPAWDVGSTTTGTAVTGYGTNGYVAYADYSGLKNPAYNPQFSLKTGATAEKLLTGDAVGKIPGDTLGSVAARILADHRTTPPAPYPSGDNYSYSRNASAIANNPDTSSWVPEVSTFKAEQKYEDAEWPYGDLPVLLLKGKNSGKADIVRYLDLITNGAYSDGNVPKTVSVTTYSYDTNTHQFTEGAGSDPASVVGDGGDFLVYKSRYDNTRNRFSLVEVTFTVNAREVTTKNTVYLYTPHTYTVSVPVMVIRELQFIDTTTFAYGTEFLPSAYNDLTTHVLEGTDTPITAYLTLQYNRDESKYSEYGWEDLLNEGSKDFLDIEKVLQFDNNGKPMPSGTRLTLLDCQHGNKMYFCEINDGRTEISFRDFRDSVGLPFQSSMADILGVTCTRNNASGKFVESTEDKATVLLNGTPYRPWTADDGTANRFDLTIPDFSQKDLADLPKENYLLVMEIPDQGENFSLNGQLHIGLNNAIASTGTAVHRSPSATTKPGDNDEFSYLIFSGYRQNPISLNATGTYNLPQKPSSQDDPIMRFHLQDTITFSSKQAYNEQDDHLYLKFSATPLITENGKTISGQFPAGTSGTVHFYVHNAEKTQYFALNTQGEWVTNSTEVEAVSGGYGWTSNGDSIELPLSSDGTVDTLLDLASIREKVKDITTDDSSFVVTAYMEVDFSKLLEKDFEDTIPASEGNGTDRYVQLHYQAQLSTQTESLNYSSAKEFVDDRAKYYRAVTYQAILSMDARYINQLGINPLAPEPQYLSTDNKTSQIDLTAVLDLSNLENPEDVLEKITSITFKLSLERRQDLDNGDLNYVPVGNSNSFISFDSWNYDSTDNNWSMKIDKADFDQYSENGQTISMDVTAHVSLLQKNYANYTIRLVAEFFGAKPNINSDDAYVVYTYACIDPSFYEPGLQPNTG